MAVTNNVLNAINVFSSTSVFNSNKGSVGANDLNFIKQTTAELATEGGGIIAQSLGTNGYVKFANGLILQWGCKASAGTNTSVAFPISFVSACYMVLGNMSKPADHGYEMNIYPKHTWSISSFTMYTRNTDSSEFTWVAVGK